MKKVWDKKISTIKNHLSFPHNKILYILLHMRAYLSFLHISHICDCGAKWKQAFEEEKKSFGRTGRNDFTIVAHSCIVDMLQSFIHTRAEHF